MPLRQTRGEKIGAIDGINLFFGALLGANLGAIEQMPLRYYFQMIILLVGTVMALRMLSTSDRLGYKLMTLGTYVVLVPAFLFLPALHPEGLSEDATARLGITLAVWVGSVLLMEFWPTAKPAAESDPPAP
jgi:hypothetical protein